MRFPSGDHAGSEVPAATAATATARRPGHREDLDVVAARGPPETAPAPPAPTRPATTPARPGRTSDGARRPAIGVDHHGTRRPHGARPRTRSDPPVARDRGLRGGRREAQQRQRREQGRTPYAGRAIAVARNGSPSRSSSSANPAARSIAGAVVWATPHHQLPVPSRASNRSVNGPPPARHRPLARRRRRRRDRRRRRREPRYLGQRRAAGAAAARGTACAAARAADGGFGAW